MGGHLAQLSEEIPVKTLGLIVNPIAGMGGSVGLKGTDGLADAAKSRGAVPRANERAEAALKELLCLREDLLVLCAGGAMGEDIAKALGFAVRIVHRAKATSDADDTIAAARAMADADLLLFAGGDGTARDLVRAGVQKPAVGIPAGVKIHSPVYAVRPQAAGRLALRFLRSSGLRTQEAEVVDIDEDAWRKGIVRTSLFGYLTVPDASDLLQHGKAASPASERAQQLAIAADMAERLNPNAAYLVGPGSTTQVFLESLGLQGSLLGVDLLCCGKLLQSDLCEADVLAAIALRETHLVLTPTGGQGYLLGRGNQQISGEAIKRIGRERIHVLATPQKLFSLQARPLYVDTGDAEADRMLCGYVRVITGYHEERMQRISCGE